MEVSPVKNNTIRSPIITETTREAAMPMSVHFPISEAFFGCSGLYTT